jgi:NAD(P)H-nitrite reductase large subunit
MILCMIGIVFPTEWLKETGILFGRGIIANEYLETSVPDVWTAGDCAEYNDTILKETVCLGNWMNSRMQGETAAFGMLGQKKVFSLVSFQTSHGFGDVIGFAGDVRALADRTMIFRGNPETNSLTRLIIQGNRIVGTTLVNRINEMGTIVKLIEKNTDISAKQAELADLNFDLKTLLG